MVPKVQSNSDNDNHCKNAAHTSNGNHIHFLDFYLSFERTGFDIWTHRRTLHIHCGIIVIEVSLPYRGPNQTWYHKPINGRAPFSDRAPKDLRQRSTRASR